MAESLKGTFDKLLGQLAGQLWRKELEATLQSQHLNGVLTEREKRRISSYQELFEVLVEKQRLGPCDLTLLSAILKQQSTRSHLDFLRPFYEAGFGHQGLEDGGNEADKDGPISSAPRPRAFGFIKLPRGNKKRPVCCETRFKVMLQRIGTNVNSEELSALKLLCQDAIARRQIESCPSGLDLITALCKKQCITGKRPQFLYRLLQDCGRQDLTSYIDQYIYVCLMRPGGTHHHAANSLDDEDIEDADLNALLKRDRRSQGKNYQFRRALKKLGDEISQSDLQNMKYVSMIPEGKLEKVENIFDFFLLLEDLGKLSRSNLSFLEQLLDEKVHLVIPLYEKGFGQKKAGKMNTSDRLKRLPIDTMFGANPEMNFKRLIKTIGSRLTKDDVKTLKFMCRDSTSACLEDIESGMELLACLEKSQKISRGDVNFLAESLESIGRKDLQKYLSMYKNSTPRSSLTPSSPLPLPDSVRPLAIIGFETTDDDEYSDKEFEEFEDNASITHKTNEEPPLEQQQQTCTCTSKLNKSKTPSRGQIHTPTLTHSLRSTPSSSSTMLVEQTEFQQLKEAVVEKETLLQAEREKHALQLELQKSRQECEMLKMKHDMALLKKEQEIAQLQLQKEREHSDLQARLAAITAAASSAGKHSSEAETA